MPTLSKLFNEYYQMTAPPLLVFQSLSPLQASKTPCDLLGYELTPYLKNETVLANYIKKMYTEITHLKPQAGVKIFTTLAYFLQQKHPHLLKTLLPFGKYIAIEIDSLQEKNKILELSEMKALRPCPVITEEIAHEKKEDAAIIKNTEASLSSVIPPGVMGIVNQYICRHS